MSPPCHIVHVIESFSGGSAQVVRVLTRLKALPDGTPLRHSVVHGWRPDSTEAFRDSFDPDVRLLPWPHAVREISPTQDALALLSLLSAWRELGPIDIVHLHSSKAGTVGRAAALLTGRRARTVYTAHGVAMIRHDVSERKRRLFALIERVAALGGREVVACSPSEQRVFAAEGIRARLIPNGMPDVPVPPRPERPLRRVLAVGRLTAAKNPAFFAEIARAAAAEGLPLEFVWVGDGELRADLADSPVRLTGWMSQDQVQAELDAADLFVSTSLWEGLSLAALQAMSAAVPLLLSRCAGNQDLLAAGDFAAGFATTAEALAWLRQGLDNPQRLMTMGAAARRYFEQSFTEGAMCSAYLNLYAGLL